MKKRLLLIARDSAIEPLGLMYLAAIARDEGWDVDIRLESGSGGWYLSAFAGHAYDMYGMTVYTGTHKDAFELCDTLKPAGAVTIIGGPHATCFPAECAEHADYVVQGEGLHSLRMILRGEAEKGVIPFTVPEPLPVAYRDGFYESSPKHRDSPIKSAVAWTGCPFACSYCYNSMGKDKFPLRKRCAEDVVLDCEIAALAPGTKLLYFQDDVFGASLKWLEKFAPLYGSRVGLPFHCQTRVELLDPRRVSSIARLGMLKDAGCTGITVAIECADEDVRRNVLGRRMDNATIFDAIGQAARAGFRIRTEQMVGLPVPDTLEVDLRTLEMNVRLRGLCGEPTMAWASTFTPYRGTKIGDYCSSEGYYNGNNNDIPPTFFERSVLRWKVDGEWLEGQALEDYRGKLLKLRKAFHFLALVPKGHELARRWLYNEDENMMDTLKTHLYDDVIYGVA